MPILSVVRPDRPVTPFTRATITVGADTLPVRCLPIQSIAAVLEPGQSGDAPAGAGVTAEWLGLVDEPGLGFDAQTTADEMAAVAASFMAVPPRLRRRQRGVASRAVLLGCGTGG
jgi:hypothetical protein